MSAEYVIVVYILNYLKNVSFRKYSHKNVLKIHQCCFLLKQIFASHCYAIFYIIHYKIKAFYRKFSPFVLHRHRIAPQRKIACFRLI